MSDFSDWSIKFIMKSLNRMAVDPDIQKINHIQYKVEWISSLFIYVLMNGPPNITKKTIQLKTKCNNRKLHSVNSGLFLKFSVIMPKRENKILKKVWTGQMCKIQKKNKLPIMLPNNNLVSDESNSWKKSIWLFSHSFLWMSYEYT